LRQKGKLELLEEVKRPSQVDIHYIRQKEPLGLGHAVWCARKFIGDEPFAVLLGDDIVQAEVPALKQLIDQFNRYRASVIGVKPVSPDEVERYGIVQAQKMDEGFYRVLDLVEKPKKEEAPSNLAIMGRYILTPRIFDLLGEQQAGSGGEIQLTDAISALNKVEAVYAYEFVGTRYDVGEKMGYIRTMIEMALQREELRDDLLAYLQRLVEKEKTLSGSI